jgi:hypothetical protein
MSSSADTALTLSVVKFVVIVGSVLVAVLFLALVDGRRGRSVRENRVHEVEEEQIALINPKLRAQKTHLWENHWRGFALPMQEPRLIGYCELLPSSLSPLSAQTVTFDSSLSNDKELAWSRD